MAVPHLCATYFDLDVAVAVKKPVRLSPNNTFEAMCVWITTIGLSSTPTVALFFSPPNNAVAAKLQSMFAGHSLLHYNYSFFSTPLRTHTHKRPSSAFRLKSDQSSVVNRLVWNISHRARALLSFISTYVCLEIPKINRWHSINQSVHRNSPHCGYSVIFFPRPLLSPISHSIHSTHNIPNHHPHLRLAQWSPFCAVEAVEAVDHHFVIKTFQKLLLLLDP